MPDIIQILPDAVANQIAAGEVIQRPASAVKELIENAVDASSTEIRLIVKEGGKNFIQVADNGKGMSETDARMSFERHATSKIRKSDDLFAIRTKGFRGEALASVAAVAKVNVKTRRAEDSMGTQLDVEASEVVLQEPCSCPQGTTFTIRNLFYNVPARRKFLKSDAVELKHIIDEFQRVALAHPGIGFSMHNNATPVYQLDGGTFRQRIVSMFGKSYNERLVPVEEQTDIVKIGGFIVKPEFSKKTRGEQFFFVNDRFIKSAYLHHALTNAFDELLPKESHPGYFITLEIDPAKIDINIHPTKTEIKFEDERFIYAVLQACVRKGLGKYNITPSLDFERETIFDVPFQKDIADVPLPSIRVNPDYNPFTQQQGAARNAQRNDHAFMRRQQEEADEWLTVPEIREVQARQFDEVPEGPVDYFQFQNRYIVASFHKQVLIVDQHRAHERIIYERLQQSLEKHAGASQMALFPETLELNAADHAILFEIVDDLRDMGFDLEEFGATTVIIRGVPADAAGHDIRSVLENMIEQFKNASKVQRSERRDQLVKILANRMAVRSGMVLNGLEIATMVTDLFQCRMPYVSPSGKPVVYAMTPDELDEKFLKHKF